MSSPMSPWANEIAEKLVAAKLNQSCLVALSRATGTVSEAQEVLGAFEKDDSLKLSSIAIRDVANALGFKGKPRTPKEAPAAPAKVAPAPKAPKVVLKNGWRKEKDQNSYRLFKDGDALLQVTDIGDAWELTDLVGGDVAQFVGTAAAAKKNAETMFLPVSTPA